MNLAPRRVPLGLGAWHARSTREPLRPMAMDASASSLRIGRLAARSRCLLRDDQVPARGTRPVGMGNERSPGMIRGLGHVVAPAHDDREAPEPGAAPTTRRVRMKRISRGAAPHRDFTSSARRFAELVHGGGRSGRSGPPPRSGRW